MAEASPAAVADAAPKKGRSGLLLVIIAALVAASAAGGGAYFVFSSKVEALAHDKDKKEHGEKGAQQKPKAPAQYIKMDPPFVVNFEAKGAMRFLQVSIELMTRDPATADLLKLHDPRIRNDLLLLLGNQQMETISSREGKEGLRAEALKAVANVIGSEGGDPKQVEQLFFTSFVMQ
ncbi:MAG TPA: flagellar basal body-associated FliL family protein [Steroidobacteraceae bacterium]